jgi:hypothetical protein
MDVNRTHRVRSPDEKGSPYSIPGGIEGRTPPPGQATRTGPFRTRGALRGGTIRNFARRPRIYVEQGNVQTSNPVVPEAASTLAEGTAQAFGGTAGTLLVQDPRTLPSANLQQQDMAKLRRLIRDTPNDQFARHTAILNRPSLFNISDYETIMLGRQAEKLQGMSNEATQQLKWYSDSKRFFNLSLAEIAQRTALTVVVVLMELVKHFSPEAREKRKYMGWHDQASQFAQIFIMDNRIIYLGVFMVFLSAVFMAVFLSS